jgi:cytochrome P450
VDLLDPAVVADPHPAFHELRAADPVHWSETHRAWMLTRYDDVLAAFRDDDTLSADRITPLAERLKPEDRERYSLVYDLLANWMVFLDPPAHDRLRRLVNRAFTPRAVERLRPTVEAIVADLLDGYEAVGGGDLRPAVAFPLPAIVIAAMLGVPPEDRDRFKAWSDDLSAVVFSVLADPDRLERAHRGAEEFTAYFRWLVDRRRDDPADDLVSALVAAREGDDTLTVDEIVSTCTLLLFGGHETTTNALANAMAVLLSNPDAAARLRDDPALAPTAVEELLRLEGVSKIMVRRVARDHERRGRALREGQPVYLVILAADHDPERFPDPDRVDLARRPNPHLGFGHGTHFCLGAPLARLELQVAVPALLRRFPRLALTEPPAWSPNILGRALARLPLRLDG